MYDICIVGLAIIINNIQFDPDRGLGVSLGVREGATVDSGKKMSMIYVSIYFYTKQVLCYWINWDVQVATQVFRRYKAGIFDISAGVRTFVIGLSRSLPFSLIPNFIVFHASSLPVMI